MLFNSIDFAVFLPLVFIVYWIVGSKRIKSQNIILLGASYIFYGWWDWRFLILIVASSLVDFIIGLKLEKETNSTLRKALLITSVAINLGLLGFFKYFNFFLDNFLQAFHWFGYPINQGLLSIVLPVGISFYTFQTLSYTIDVYRGKLSPTRDFIAFSAFIAFFPQLVAGPIERATNLLPQFQSERKFNYLKAVDGLRQILWGLVKKIIIADKCGEYVNLIFDNHEIYSGSTLFIGAVLFSFQIYGDFSGYSDIAIGTSRLFGFDLMRNFAFPYFSRDIAEFWRRWHISLSTWFRDYLYIPLGGSQAGHWIKIRNTFIIFLVSGFWHGANWTFIVWGGLNSIYFLPLLLTNTNRINLGIVAQDSRLPSFQELYKMIFTFCLITLAWIFFRSDSVVDAFSMIRKIFSTSLFASPEIFPLFTFILISLFVGFEWLGRRGEFGLQAVSLSLPKVPRWALYFILIIGLFLSNAVEQEFIYFQF
jgi:alginate O-acetyltransferase complex protein AlgI